MNTKTIIILISAVLIAGGYWLISSRQSDTSEAGNTPTAMMKEEGQSANPSESASDISAETIISMDEVSKHNTADDCWFVIDGKVLDVTSFIASGNHPGKDAILAGCGKDATGLFTGMESPGKPHSEKAQEGSKQFIIGTLAQ